MKHNKKTYSLITGGAGFMGSHISKHCIDIGHNVIILDDLSEGNIENIPPDSEFIEGSIMDRNLVYRIFKEYPISYVYHLAAYASVGLSHFVRSFNYSLNILGSINLINASLNSKVKCFIFTSSTAVYGNCQLPYIESMCPEPEDPYGISKLAIEHDLKAAHESFGMNYIIFRPHNVYGSHQNIGDPYRNVIGVFIRNILENKPLKVFGDGNQVRAFSYIDDIAPIISNSVTIQAAYNNTYNIGTEKTTSINKLISILENVCKKKAIIQYYPSLSGTKNAYASHEKFNKMFGYRTNTTLEMGLGEMVKWVERVGVRTSKRKYKIELDHNFPKYWDQDGE